MVMHVPVRNNISRFRVTVVSQARNITHPSWCCCKRFSSYRQLYTEPNSISI